jgi:hypothetical protein
MIKVICPVCCALVAHEGRIVRGPTAEFAKCTHGNVRDCIELWRAWMRADTLNVYQAVSDAERGWASVERR